MSEECNGPFNHYSCHSNDDLWVLSQMTKTIIWSHNFSEGCVYGVIIIEFDQSPCVTLNMLLVTCFIICQHLFELPLAVSPRRDLDFPHLLSCWRMEIDLERQSCYLFIRILTCDQLPDLQVGGLSE